MKRYTQAMMMLAVGQILCLACGLWVSDRFSHTSVQVRSNKSSSGSTANHIETKHERFVGRCLSLLWISGLQASVAFLVLMWLMMETRAKNAHFSMQILHREKDLLRTRNAVIFGLAKLADYRDREVGQHLERIALYSTCLASAMRSEPRYREAISGTFVKLIGISSVLHDVGKVAIEDAILKKAGPLTPDERQQMQLHTAVGSECIAEIERRLGNCNFLSTAREIAQCHHERWDGKGYPQGISGQQIPIAARIIAIADVYDALASVRVYKEAFPHEKCVQMIVEGSGSQFDPGLVEVFVKIAPQFRQIAQRFRDSQAEVDTSSTVTPSIRASGDRLIKSLLEQADSSETLATVS